LPGKIIYRQIEEVKGISLEEFFIDKEQKEQLKER
jgi:hypothetical protein